MVDSSRLNKPGIVGTLVKWEGDSAIPEDAGEHPERYPEVLEVVKCGDGYPQPQVIYRRA